MAGYLPTLSAIGWTNSLTEKLDFALAHWFECEPSLSYLYQGEEKAISVQRMIAENPSDIEALINQMATGLNQYLRNIFDHAEVTGINVSREKNNGRYVQAESKVGDRVEIKMEIRVIDKDEQGNLKQQNEVRFANFKFNKFTSITGVSNYGTL